MNGTQIGSYFRHYTADEIPGLFSGELRQIRYETAELVAKHNDVQSLARDMDVDAAVAQAISDYVRPRWPELF